jgi:hypothetical protein
VYDPYKALSLHVARLFYHRVLNLTIRSSERRDSAKKMAIDDAHDSNSCVRRFATDEKRSVLYATTNSHHDRARRCIDIPRCVAF